VPADPKNGFTVRRKTGKNTVKPLDYTRLNRYYSCMDSEIGLRPTPTKRIKIMSTAIAQAAATTKGFATLVDLCVALFSSRNHDELIEDLQSATQAYDYKLTKQGSDYVCSGTLLLPPFTLNRDNIKKQWMGKTDGRAYMYSLSHINSKPYHYFESLAHAKKYVKETDHNAIQEFKDAYNKAYDGTIMAIQNNHASELSLQDTLYDGRLKIAERYFSAQNMNVTNLVGSYLDGSIMVFMTANHLFPGFTLCHADGIEFFSGLQHCFTVMCRLYQVIAAAVIIENAPFQKLVQVGDIFEDFRNLHNRCYRYYQVVEVSRTLNKQAVMVTLRAILHDDNFLPVKNSMISPKLNAYVHLYRDGFTACYLMPFAGSMAGAITELAKYEPNAH
jgi:hypothetical protein